MSAFNAGNTDITVAMGASEECPLSSFETIELSALDAVNLGRLAADTALFEANTTIALRYLFTGRSRGLLLGSEVRPAVAGTAQMGSSESNPDAQRSRTPMHLKYAGKRSFKRFAPIERQADSGYRVECEECAEGMVPSQCPYETPVRVLAARLRTLQLLKED